MLGEADAARARRLVTRSHQLRAVLPPPPPAAAAAAASSSAAAAAAATAGPYRLLRLAAAAAAATAAATPPPPPPLRGGSLAIVTPLTSKGTRMRGIGESPFFSVLLPSLMRTWAGPASSWNYSFYIGVDTADPIYDAPGAAASFGGIFRAAVPSEAVRLSYTAFDGLRGAPSQVVAELVARAYADGYEWLFQLNDDARLISMGWEAALASVLHFNPVYPGLGATGPTDENNARIFTHAFVHRTHIDIHGRFFPRAFLNWYSDDWITSVYGASSTFKLQQVRMRHQVEAQKTAGPERCASSHNKLGVSMAWLA